VSGIDYYESWRREFTRLEEYLRRHKLETLDAVVLAKVVS